MLHQLPKEKAKQFADLFDDLDKSLDELKIDAYSISVTTMEEVFLRVGQGR